MSTARPVRHLAITVVIVAFASAVQPSPSLGDFITITPLKPDRFVMVNGFNTPEFDIVEDTTARVATFQVKNTSTRSVMIDSIELVSKAFFAGEADDDLDMIKPVSRALPFSLPANTFLNFNHQAVTEDVVHDGDIDSGVWRVVVLVTFTPSDRPQQFDSVPFLINVKDVPEPTSLMLLGLGTMVALGYRWRRRKRGLA
jgi:hypothetical protein